jgi:hypothetical protein
MHLCAELQKFSISLQAFGHIPGFVKSRLQNGVCVCVRVCVSASVCVSVRECVSVCV